MRFKIALFSTVLAVSQLASAAGLNNKSADSKIIEKAPEWKLYQAMDVHDSSKWYIAGDWGLDGPFLSGVCQSQISFAKMGTQSLLNLKLENKNCSGQKYAGAQYQSLSFYRYGFYSANLKAAKGSGVVTGFFVYTGIADGNPHDEIDIEILGKDTSKIQVNYWTNGKEHPVSIALGFDASAGFHTYAFDWQADSIKWYVDGKLVHTETGERGVLPRTPGRVMANLWACSADSWCGAYAPSLTPTVASFDWMGYR